MVRHRMRSTRLRAYGALALGALCIGFSAIFVKWSEVPGTVSALYRMVIATVVLALPFGGQLSRKRVTRNGRIWLLALVAGVFFALDLAVWNSSLSLTSAANATSARRPASTNTVSMRR